MSPLLYLMVFFATVLAVQGVIVLLLEARRGTSLRARRRLQRLAGQLQAAPSAESILRAARQGRFRLAEIALGVLPNRERLELLLYRAGAPMTPQRFLGTTGVLAGIGWLLLSALSDGLVSGLPGLALGLVPLFVLRRRAHIRMREFEEQLPDGLELLTRSLRAGHSLATGFHLVGDEMQDPIGSEFSQVAEEIKFGLDVRHALLNLAHRIENPDLPYFVTAVLIQRESGGNLAEILDNLGSLIRERAKLHGKVRTITAQGRMTAAVLAIWPAVTVALLAVTNPDYIQPLFETPTGHTAIGVAAALCLVGYTIARRMAYVRV